MITIRNYCPSDAQKIGILIAETYNQFNLATFPSEERESFLGPFQHAESTEIAKQKLIAQAIEASFVFVAEFQGEIVGVLRGRKDKLQSLFVKGAFHRQGIGRKLVARFEQECRSHGGDVIRVMATLFAIEFYQATGYKKSTGVRRMKSFEGVGLLYQPMKKILK